MIHASLSMILISDDNEINVKIQQVAELIHSDETGRHTYSD